MNPNPLAACSLDCTLCEMIRDILAGNATVDYALMTCFVVGSRAMTMSLCAPHQAMHKDVTRHLGLLQSSRTFTASGAIKARC